MVRIALIALAGMLGAAALVAGYRELAPAPVETALVEAVEIDHADDESRMRLCIGPARVTFGGDPFIGLAFGGDGCSVNAADLVGFRILRGPPLPAGPQLTLTFPL